MISLINSLLNNRATLDAAPALCLRVERPWRSASERVRSQLHAPAI